MVRPLIWTGDRLRLLDQTQLPGGEIYLELSTYDEVAQAIKEMRVRGAPAIGIAAAYGLLLGARSIKEREREAFLERLGRIRDQLASTRPTAVNLFQALDRLMAVARKTSLDRMTEVLERTALNLEAEELEAERRLGRYGASFIKDGFGVLTHCNAGGLATAGYGTALGIIRAAWEEGKRFHVYATETRPLLQGARLTAWELKKEGIPFTLITDNMVGHFMKMGKINCVIVGADRIALNGDVANKIGTYSLAVLAYQHNIPFYVAAPLTTIDPDCPSGDAIPIEERDRTEVTHIGEVPIAPEGVMAANPAFDVTPHHLISAIVTEKGIIGPPYSQSLKEVLGR